MSSSIGTYSVLAIHHFDNYISPNLTPITCIKSNPMIQDEKLLLKQIQSILKHLKAGRLIVLLASGIWPAPKVTQKQK